MERGIEAVLEQPGGVPSHDLEITQYARYMAALGYMWLGATADADCHLAKLGLEWRLSQQAFGTRGPADNSQPTVVPRQLGMKVFDRVLRSSTLAALRRGFAPTSRFWSEHGYDRPDCTFFSFVYRLDQPPRNVVEQAVQELRSVLSMAVPGFAQAGVVEWWAHKRPVTAMWSSGFHALHFDTDELTFASDSETPLRHPLFSSIVYLENVGGPTLVINKTPGGAGLGDDGVLVWPATNRCMCFPGNRLHGVLPDCSTAVPTNGANRTSLIIAWWGPETTGRRNNGGKGPLQRIEAQDLLATHHWFYALPLVADTSIARDSGTQPTQRPTPLEDASQHILHINPVWERTIQGDTASAATTGRRKTIESSLPQLRFFVESELEFEHIYQEASVAVYWERRLQGGSQGNEGKRDEDPTPSS